MYLSSGNDERLGEFQEMPSNESGLDFGRPLQLHALHDPLDDALVLLEQRLRRRVHARLRIQLEL